MTEKGNWNETISLSVCKQWHQCRRAQNSWVHIFSYYTELDLMSQPTHGTLCVNLCFLLLLFFKSLSRGNTWVRLLSLLQWTQEYSALWFHKIIKTCRKMKLNSISMVIIQLLCFFVKKYRYEFWSSQKIFSQMFPRIIDNGSNQAHLFARRQVTNNSIPSSYEHS